jgi:hypothetical protein
MVGGNESDGVVVLLMATDADRVEVRNATASLVRGGYGYRLLGVGAAWGGWRHRMQSYRDAARSRPAHSLVVCMDAYDALALRPVAGLASTFRAFGKPLLLSLERACGGNGVVLDSWWRSKFARPWWPPDVAQLPAARFVNGGLLMGEAWKIAELYEWMLCDVTIRDDQVGLGRYALAHPDSWAPDVHCSVFRNVLCEPSFLAQRALVHEAKTDGERAEAALAVAWATLIPSNAPERLPQDDACFFAHFPGLKCGSAEAYNRAAAAAIGPSAHTICGGRRRRIVVLCLATIAALALLAIRLLPNGPNGPNGPGASPLMRLGAFAILLVALAFILAQIFS